MIESWANSATRQFAETGKNKFPGLDVEAAYELLAALEAATSLNDLSRLKWVGLHKLDGDCRGQWAMTINGPWRLCFRLDDSKAAGVEIVNYHKG
jgi:proteic killer suppression protein